eukprot:UN07294
MGRAAQHHNARPQDPNSFDSFMRFTPLPLRHPGFPDATINTQLQRIDTPVRIMGFTGDYLQHSNQLHNLNNAELLPMLGLPALSHIIAVLHQYRAIMERNHHDVHDQHPAARQQNGILTITIPITPSPRFAQTVRDFKLDQTLPRPEFLGSLPSDYVHVNLSESANRANHNNTSPQTAHLNNNNNNNNDKSSTKSNKIQEDEFQYNNKIVIIIIIIILQIQTRHFDGNRC